MSREHWKCHSHASASRGLPWLCLQPRIASQRLRGVGGRIAIQLVKAKVMNLSTKIETFYLLCSMEIFPVVGEDCGTVAAVPVLGTDKINLYFVGGQN